MISRRVYHPVYNVKRSGLYIAKSKFPLDSHINSAVSLNARLGASRADATPCATVIDFEGIHQVCKPGEVRFSGARRVENMVTFSTFINSTVGVAAVPAGWGITGVSNAGSSILPTEIVGGVACKPFRLRVTATGGIHGIQQTLYPKVGRTYVMSAWIRVPTDAVVGDMSVYFYFNGNTPGANTAASNAQLIAQPKDTWVRYSTPVTFSAVSSNNISFCIISTNPASFDIAHPMFEDVTYQTNKNPSEYVPSNEGIGFGSVISSTATTISVASATDSYAKNNINILAGTGAGQNRTVLNSIRNLVYYSEKLDHGYWGKNRGGTASTPVITPDFDLAPDGTMTADKVVFALNGGVTTTDRSDISNALNTITGKQYVFSLWAKSTDAQNYILQMSFSGVTVTGSLITVTPVWQRFEIYLSSAIDTIRNPRISLRGSQGTSDYASVLIWGIQFEEDVTVASEYMKTEATLTSILTVDPLNVLLDNTSTYEIRPKLFSNNVYCVEYFNTYNTNTTVSNVVVPGAVSYLPYANQCIGSNLILNGGFDDASGWTLSGAGASISNGKLKLIKTDSVEPSARRSITGLSQGKYYKLSYDVVINSRANNGTGYVSDNWYIPDNTSGRKEIIFLNSNLSVTNFAYSGGGGAAATLDCTIDNFELYEVARNGLAGALIETQKTNSITNSTMTGAVAGTPGTLPTSWFTWTPTTGLLTSIVATGVENGLNYIDYRLFGTPDISGSFSLMFLSSTTTVATINQYWTISVYTKLIAGSMAGISLFRTVLDEYTAAGTYRATKTTAGFTPSAALTRQINTYQLTDSLTERVQPYLNYQVVAATPIDVTIRIAAPQLELGAGVTSFIPTSTATVNRAAESQRFLINNLSATAGTVYMEVRFNHLNGVLNEWFMLDYSPTDSLQLYYQSGGLYFGKVTPGSYVMIKIGNTPTVGITYSIAVSYGPRGMFTSINGVSGQSDITTTGYASGGSSIGLEHSPNTLNANHKNVTFWRTQMNQIQLNALTRRS